MLCRSSWTRLRSHRLKRKEVTQPEVPARRLPEPVAAKVQTPDQAINVDALLAANIIAIREAQARENERQARLRQTVDAVAASIKWAREDEEDTELLVLMDE